MYTNGNFEAHMAALALLGTAGLMVLLAITTVVLWLTRRAWARYSLLALVVLLAGYAALVALFSYASYDRTAKLGDEKFFCAMDCHIGYSVQDVLRLKSIGGATAQGEFMMVTVRSHFDERSIAPWRGNGALTPDPPKLELVDGSGQRFSVSATGQKAWDEEHPAAHSMADPLRPGDMYETRWIFDLPNGDTSLRLYAGWHGFPDWALIGDEASPGHGKTYLALSP